MSRNHLLQIQNGEKAAKFGIVSLLILGTVKLFTGLITGIEVLIADSISTFADILGIFAAYLGLRLSKKSADAHFEYGYYKIETFAALLISLGIIFMGFLILRSNISEFGHFKMGENHLIAIFATFFAIWQSYFLSLKLKEAGEKSNSISLIASAKDKKMDVFASLAVLVSIIANYNQIPYIENVVSIVIALLIFKVGFYSAVESLFLLLDYWNDPILSSKIRKVLLRESDVVSKIRNLRLRRAGTFIFGEAFVEINPYCDIQDLKSELTILEKRIKELNPYIKDFSVYSHIPDKQNFLIAIPIMKGRDLSSEIAPTIASTKAYLFVKIVNKKVKSTHTKRLGKGSKKIMQLADFLKKEKVDILVNNRLNSLLYFNLKRTHHVQIYPTFKETKKAKDLLSLILIDV